MMRHTHIASVVVAMAAMLYFSSTAIALVHMLVLTLAAFAVGIVSVIWVHIRLSPQHKTGSGIERVERELEIFRNSLMRETDNENESDTMIKPSQRFPVVFGRTVDSLFQQLLDLILRDFVNVWLREYAFESDKLVETMKEDIWGAIQNLHDRMSRVDHAKLIAVDMITRITSHFEKIRLAQTMLAESNRPPIFTLSPHLMSPEKELDYLRRISEMLIMFLLPRGYSLSPAKYLLREILTCRVLQPAINLITEPDYINQKIVDYIEAQQAAAAMHRKTYEYAASFEDFLHLIQNTRDVDALKRIRYNIMTEIMQATTIQNLKRARGVDVDMDKNSAMPSGVAKAEVIAARKLKRYISQLTYAKTQCEKNLMHLGWDGGFTVQDDKKMLLLSSILDNVTGRKYLSLFLETVASHSLVGYWTAVEELRSAHRSNWHQLGAEIFYTYIRSPTAEIKVDKVTRKRMEAFLLGDKGPEVFYEVQQTVFQTLEDKYYQTFVLSHYYKEMIDAMNSEDSTSENDLHLSSEDRQQSNDSSSSIDSSMNVGDHSTYSRRKLDQLQEKLNNKMQALQALRSSLKPESRVLAILEKEVEWLQGERRQLEAHLTRTETWGEHLGKWRAVVQSAEVPDEKEPPQFVIVVHMLEEEGIDGEEGISSGWVVLRTLAQFQELHRKLRPLCANVKNLELPSQTFKFLFGKNDRNSLEKAKMQIQKYLEFVLEDDRLNHSEALYSFLSPSSDHLKHSTPSPKKSRFSFSTLFKSGSGEQQGRLENPGIIREIEEDDNISQYLDAPGSSSESGDTNHKVGVLIRPTETDGKDQIAEPLYALMGEVFDMRGLFKWLRKSLITFVQITYGRTINRQIRDTISWLFSESMLHYYTTLFMKSWWPGGVLAPAGSVRTPEMKLATAVLAKQQFVSNVPEVLTNLVGAQTARRGALKVFENVQNVRQNKQLFYDLFEILMKEVFPELKHR